MCWISNIPVRENIAKEDIPIFKVCLYLNNNIVSYYRNFIYILDRIYNTNIRFVSKQAIVNGFHSYSSKHCQIKITLSNILSILNKNRNLKLDDFIYHNNIIRVNGIIPKGSKYYLNDKGEYVSNSIKLLGYENIYADS